MPFTDTEHQLLEAFITRRREAPEYHVVTSAAADLLRHDLPDLDDATIARVTLALATQLNFATTLDPALVPYAVVFTYTAAALAEGSLTETPEALE